MYSFAILFTLIGLCVANLPVQTKKIDFLESGKLEECEGKDSSNYTLIAQYTENQLCDLNSVEESGIDWLIACSQKGEKVVNALKILARSELPAGAYYQQETLYLSKYGNLDGKYVYIKEIGLRFAYLKKCSSVLGYSFVTTKSLVLLVVEKLDLSIFWEPTGAYEPFKKISTTVCKGKAINV